MNLQFNLLIVDDAADGVGEAVRILRDYLESKGFVLRQKVAENLSENGLRDLARQEGKDYDLVMVDYNLGREDTDGAAAAYRLRRELQYTDMVFYSSDRELNLYEKVADQALSGVFIARRDNLDEALKGLADTVIGKVVDVNQMRGIAMAEVAEMDVVMERTLVHVLEREREQFETGTRRTVAKVREAVRDLAKAVETRLTQGGVAAVVSDGRLFSSAHKYRAVRRLARLLAEPPGEALGVLETYEAEILRKRNMLAHSEERTAEDGTVVLQSIKRGEAEVINDAWMVGFRLELRKHRNALETVCGALDREVGTEAAGQTTEE